MKTKLAIALLLFLIILGAYNVYQNNKIQAGVDVGNRAPDITLETINGKTLKLSDFKGKIVIVNFWATWCTPCEHELPVLKKFYNENKNKQIVVLGLNATSTERSKSSVQDFSKNNHLNYPILSDTHGKYSDLFHVRGYPTTYFINSKGVIKKRYIGQLTLQKLKRFTASLK